jgi:hypothetical protein
MMKGMFHDDHCVIPAPEDIAMMQTWEEGLVTGWDPTVAP